MNIATRTEQETTINPVSHERSQTIRFRRTIRTCAALVAGFGLVALAGWMLGQPELFCLGMGNIPMAPSTAILLALSAIALFLRFHFTHRGAYLAGFLINTVVAVTVTLLFVHQFSVCPGIPVMMFAILAAGIVIAGFLYFRSLEKTYRVGVKNQLFSIGDLKAGELCQWRKGRLENGSIIFRTEMTKPAYFIDFSKMLKDLGCY